MARCWPWPKKMDITVQPEIRLLTVKDGKERMHQNGKLVGNLRPGLGG